jgi:hypothetical protein
LKKGIVQEDTLAVRFREGAAPPSGCFALSRRSGAVACLVGHHRVGSQFGERYLTVLSSRDDAPPNVPVHIRPSDAGPLLESESQRMLDELMVQGDYVALTPPLTLPPDGPRTFGKLTVELRREEIRSVPPIWDVAVAVRPETDDIDAGSADPLLVNTLTAVTCAEPTISLRELSPSLLLVERECRADEDGETEVMLAAWLCDSERSRCE